MRPLPFVRALVTLALLVHATSAFADETPAARLFREGRALMLEGRFDEACPRLEESQQLEPHVGTLLNVAACHERQGKVGSAWVEYQKALTAARAEGQADRVVLAGQRIKALEPRVPWLRVSSRAEDLVITLDGSPIERVAWDHEMPVDPTTHTVVASRQGAPVFEERIELREGERHTVHVEVVASLPSPSAGQERVIVEPPPAAEGKPTEGRPTAPPKHSSPWVFEPGLFVGLVAGTSQNPRGLGYDLCPRGTCGELENASNVAAGFNVFVGYALSDAVHLGARLLVAPLLGPDGAALYGLGPAVSFRANDVFTIGVWGFFGDATLRGQTRFTQENSDGTSYPSTINAEGNLRGGLGAGLELSLHLFDVGRGEVVLTSNPFVIAGSNGTAACLPIGLAYRFQ